METIQKQGLIPAERQDALIEAVEKLNKRAAKLGLPAINLQFGAGVWKEDRAYGVDVRGELKRRLFFPATLEGAAVHFDGWTVVAAIDVVDAAAGVVVVRTHQPTERPEWRQKVGQCDHCNITRRRNKTVVVQNAAGEQKVLGVDCLKDFVPSAARNVDLLLEIHEMLLSPLDTAADDESMGGSSHPRFMEIATYLPYVAELVLRHGGYVSAKTAEQFMKEPTSGTAMRHCYVRNVENRIVPSEDARELASKAIEYAAAMEPSSSYEQNIAGLAKAGYAQWRHLGFVASIVPAYQRHLERMVEQAAKERLRFTDASSLHVGRVGEKLTVRVVLTKVIAVDGVYGLSHLHIFRDESGNVLKWFCSGSRPDFPTDGTLVEIVATVKDHGMRQGVKETALTRVRLAPEKKAPKARKSKSSVVAV